MTEPIASSEAEETPEQAEEVSNDATEESTESAPELSEVGEESEEEQLPLFSTVEEAEEVVRKLRSENAERRVKNNELESSLSQLTSHFEGADSEFQNAWLALGKELIANPQSEDIKAVFAELAAGNITEEEAEEALEEIQEESEAPSFDASQVAEQINGLFAKKEAELAAKAEAVAQEAELNKIAAEVRELGFDPEATLESDAAAFARHRLLWDFVASQPDGERDLSKAKEAVESYEKSILDNHLAALKASNSGVPSLSGSGVVEDPASKKETAYEKTVRVLGG